MIPTVEQDIATGIRNLKGTKKKQLIEAALALERLKTVHGYRTNAAVGRTVGVSAEIVREFLTLLLFPKDIQERFAQARLGLEHGRRLWKYADVLMKRDNFCWDAVRTVADVMESMTALDSRDLVEYLLNHPDTSPEDARSIVIESYGRTRRQFHVIAILTRDQFEHLSQIAKKKGASVDSLVSSIVADWLESKG